jgi:hypothetical protein
VSDKLGLGGNKLAKKIRRVRSGCREQEEARGVRGYGLDENEIKRLGLGGGGEKKVRCGTRPSGF